MQKTQEKAESKEKHPPHPCKPTLSRTPEPKNHFHSAHETGVIKK